MAAADGAFDGATEALTGTIPVAARGWSAGTRTISVRARDRAGTWSAPVAATLTITVPGQLFADGFEAGNLSAWNGGATGAGLAVAAPARLGPTGTYGLALAVGNTPAFVTDTTPTAEPSYRARFWFHPNGTGTGGNAWDLFQGASGAQVPLRVQYRRQGAATYQVRAQLLAAGGAAVATPWVTISNAPHAVEVAWTAGTGAGPRLQLFLDGALAQTLSGQNTGAYRIDTARLGRVAGPTGGAGGTLYLDQFVSSRGAAIGP
ncbi:MAG: hypothetical protein QM767_30070 [Anaeromyxobacter sp.]